METPQRIQFHDNVEQGNAPMCPLLSDFVFTLDDALKFSNENARTQKRLIEGVFRTFNSTKTKPVYVGNTDGYYRSGIDAPIISIFCGESCNPGMVEKTVKTFSGLIPDNSSFFVFCVCVTMSSTCSVCKNDLEIMRIVLYHVPDFEKDYRRLVGPFP
jgi:hypothetical protein